MEKTIKMETVYRWINIMGNPNDYDKVDMFWRFSGAISILWYLGILTEDEKIKYESEYLDKNI